jgi:putative MATE family efflux protein
VSLPRARLGDLDRRILALSIPALGAMAVEPIYGLVDTAIVGHLGKGPLGGLAVALSALNVGIYGAGFLSMVTAQRVAFRLGGGDRDGAARTAVSAYWLAAAIGLVLAAVLAGLARPIAGVLGASDLVVGHAVTYLRWAAIGVPFQLFVLAGNGHRRGMADTRTPLKILVVANVVNVALEVLFVPVLGWGVAGSAVGTVVAQVVSGLWFLLLSARVVEHRILPARADVVDLLRSGGVVVIRTLALLGALTAATAVAARLSAAKHGGHQIGIQVFFLLALTLDALAVPAATFVADALGRGDLDGAGRVASRCLRLSLVASVATAGFAIVGSPFLPRLFSDDAGVRSAATVALLLCGLAQPLAALAFCFDGILLGAGDFAVLRTSMLLALIPFAVPAVATLIWPRLGIAGVWAAVAVWLGTRALLLARRWRSGNWLPAAAAAAA